MLSYYDLKNNLIIYLVKDLKDVNDFGRLDSKQLLSMSDCDKF